MTWSVNFFSFFWVTFNPYFYEYQCDKKVRFKITIFLFFNLFKYKISPLFCRIGFHLESFSKSPVFPLNKPMRQFFSKVPFYRIERSSQSGINDHQNNATFFLRYSAKFYKISILQNIYTLNTLIACVLNY